MTYYTCEIQFFWIKKQRQKRKKTETEKQTPILGKKYDMVEVGVARL